jgi:two-component system response regulator YesN
MYQECNAIMEARYFLESPVVFAADCRAMNLEFRWKRLVITSCKIWESLGVSFYQELQKEAEGRMAQPLQDEQSWKLLFLGLMEWTYIYLGIPSNHAALMELSGAERIKASATIQDSIQAWENHLAETAKVKWMIKSVSKEVAYAVQYIHQNFDKDISLKEISEFVQLSPNYLSLLFKKEMDCNLIEFLTNYRVEKAKELMLNTSLKTYEIAENVGISDSAYFSRIFKKSTGVSPIDFRKKKVMGRKED